MNLEFIDWEVEKEFDRNFESYDFRYQLNHIISSNYIGKYIKYVLDDAKADFLKDNMDLFKALEDKQKKQVFGITGSIVVPILNTYL